MLPTQSNRLHEPLNGRAPVLEESTSFPSDTPEDRVPASEDLVRIGGTSEWLHDQSWNDRPKPTRKIAIVGKAPSSMHLAPYDDPSWEIWGLSNGAFAGEVKRWDTWFELHNLEAGHARWADACPGYWSWLKQADAAGKRLFIGRPHPEFPNAIVYPWQKVFERFGSYFNNSVAEMIAIAVMDGVTELGIWGVDMAQSDPVLHNGNSEYQHQRPSCEYILGMVQALGIKLTIPPESDLLKCHRVYAYEDAANDGLRLKLKARKAELKQRHAQAMEQMNGHKAQYEQWRMNCVKFEGALEDIDYVLQRTQ